MDYITHAGAFLLIQGDIVSRRTKAGAANTGPTNGNSVRQQILRNNLLRKTGTYKFFRKNMKIKFDESGGMHHSSNHGNASNTAFSREASP